MSKKGTPLKSDISDSGFDKYLTRPFEGLGEANREFEEQTGYSYADLVASMEGAKVQGFTTTIAFTSTDYRTVTWAAGTISYQDGLVTPEIATTNTGNMAARTYIYYDPQASKVALNTTTTAATATKGERLLLAIATPNANTAGMASVETFGSTGTYVANLSVEHLTAGSIRSKTVTLAVTAGTGDCYIGTGKTDFTNTDSGFILGIDDSDSDKAKFYIGDATTYLNWDAATLTVKGALTATSGAIGGWTINATSIYTGTEDHAGYTANAGDITIYSSGTDASIHAKNFYIDTSGNITATGVTLTGAITATSGAIGGWTINSTSIYTGTEDHSGYTANAGDITIYSDGTDSSIHANNFYIDTSGNITATGVTLTGAITASSGSIGGFTIGASSLSVVAGGNTVTLSSSTNALITGPTGSPTVTITQAGVITATGVVLTGAITSSTGNERIIFDSGDYLRFYAGGTLRCSIRGVTATRATGIAFDGDLVMDNNKSLMIKSTTGGATEYGGVSITSGNEMWLTLGTVDTFFIKNNAQDDNFFTVSNDRAYHKLEFQANKLTSNSGDLTLDPEGSNKVNMAGNIDMQGNNIDDCGTLWSGGFSLILASDKTAIVPTSKGYNALYCTESPEVWFMDFCETKDELDPLFLEVTEKPYHFIKCEDGEYQVWGKRKGKADKRFELKTREEFLKNEKFYNMARID